MRPGPAPHFTMTSRQHGLRPEEVRDVKRMMREMLPESDWQVSLTNEPGTTLPADPLCSWCLRPPLRPWIGLLLHPRVCDEVRACDVCTSMLVGLGTHDPDLYRKRREPLTSHHGDFFDQGGWKTSADGNRLLYRSDRIMILVEKDAANAWTWEAHFPELNFHNDSKDATYPGLDDALREVVRVMLIFYNNVQ